MLRSLFVQNYAIIDQVRLDLITGFNVITGETGAGKSILLGALNLILGGRADTRVLYDKHTKCIVEATFTPSTDTLKRLIADGLLTPQEKDVIIKREISSTGKSRAYINDNVARLQDIKVLVSRLVDIHNQFDTLSLTSTEYQMQMIDAVAGNQKILSKYQLEYSILLELRAELRNLEKSKNKSADDLEYVKYQLEELEKYGLDGMDKKILEDEYETLINAEQIKTHLSKASDTLVESEYGAESQIRECLRDLDTYADSNVQIAEITQHLEEILESLRDVDTIANRLNDNLEVDEERAAELKELLDHVNFLEKKHEVNSIEELVQLRDTYRQRSVGSEDIESLIKAKKEALKKHNEVIKKAAVELTRSRKDVFQSISKRLERSLYDLAMPNAKVVFELEKADDYGLMGIDLIDLLFSSNKGIDPQSISEVASGGEMSRLALSAKSMIAELHGVPTLIFDEIDTGISGAVALKVGHILNDIAFSRQVVCITHSAQVASIAQRHFLVAKRDTAERTITNVALLNEDDRVQEIAKMLSTDPPNSYAIQNARELLNHN